MKSILKVLNTIIWNVGFGFVAITPLFAFSLISFIKFPSVYNALVAIIGLLSPHFFNWNLVAIQDINRRIEIGRFMLKFRDCTFEEMHLNDYVDSTTESTILNQIQHLSYDLKFSSNTKNVEINQKIAGKFRIFRIVKSHPNATLPKQLVAYHVLSWNPSLIFLPDKAGQLNSIRKFYLLHEIGHCSAQAKHDEFLMWTYKLCTWLTIPWMLINSSISIFSVLLIGIYYLLVRIAYSPISTSKFDVYFASETNADRFALFFLDQNDKLLLSDQLKKYPNILPKDNRMSNEANTLRIQNIENLGTDGTLNFSPNHIVTPQNALLILGLLTITTAFFFGQPVTFFSGIAAITLFTILPLMIYFLILVPGTVIWDLHVENLLRKQPQAEERFKTAVDEIESYYLKFFRRSSTNL